MRLSCLLVTGGVLLLSMAIAAAAQLDQLQDRLDKALVSYNEARATAIKPVEESLRRQIEAARNKGDLDLKKSLEAAVESLQKGAFPSLLSLRGAVGQARRELVRAKSRLLAEYRAIEREYVKQGNDVRAEATRAEFLELENQLADGAAAPVNRRRPEPVAAEPVAAEPVAAEPVREVFLSDLPERDALAWGAFGKNGDLGYEEKRITVRGVVAEKGLSTAPFGDGLSTVTYDVPQGFNSLKAVAAMNDTADPGIQVTSCRFKVLCGEKLLWESPPLRGKGAFAECNIPLSDCSAITLIVECPGIHNCAHAVWVDPRFSVVPQRATLSMKEGAAAKALFLSDLPEINPVVGHERFGKKGELGFGGFKVSIHGTPSPHGLGMHPAPGLPATVAYDVPKGAVRFEATVGLNDTVAGESHTPVIFRVIDNNNFVLWQSRPLQKAGDSNECVIDLGKTKRIRLEVTCGNGHNQAHAVWVEPRFTTK